MQPNLIRQRWNAGRPALGTFVFSRDPATTEIAAHAGFDFVVIDMEHAPLDLVNVEGHLRAAAARGIAALVRISGGDRSLVGRVLDLGANGIAFPHFGVDIEASRAFSDSLRYAPGGARPSCASVRATGYSLLEFGAYTRGSDEDVIGIGLIEDIDVVPRLGEILRECRIDALMPGTGDLSTSMGLPGQPLHPQVLQQVDHIIDAARAAGVRLGMYPRSTGEVRQWQPRKPDFYIYQLDLKVLAQAYGKAAAELRDAVAD